MVTTIDSMSVNTTFPRLYVKDSKGLIRVWDISVSGATITTAYGVEGGAIQTAADVIRSGKNAGRSNATTPESQAMADAKGSWIKQKKSGYVESRDDALAGRVDEFLIEGGIEPMLAKSFEDDGHKIVYPCHAQPKLDGIRCVAVYDPHASLGSRVTLWTRTRKPIKSCPHVASALEPMFIRAESCKNSRKITALDGEFYNHDMKNDFEQIVSAVRKDAPSEISLGSIQFHVYDCVTDTPLSFAVRHTLSSMFFTATTMPLLPSGKPVVEMVVTRIINNKDELEAACSEFQDKGYEGAMARNAASPYEFKRSAHLQKLKTFKDDEFEIVGFEEGNGKLAGHVGSFVLAAKFAKEPGATFKAKLDGSLSALKDHWGNREAILGKMLTVKYQGLTAAGIPRFPVGKAIRDYE